MEIHNLRISSSFSARWGADEQPSPALRARTELEIDLYKKGYATHLGAHPWFRINPPAEAEVFRQLSIEAGVPAEASVIEDQANDIEQSARMSRRSPNLTVGPAS